MPSAFSTTNTQEADDAEIVAFGEAKAATRRAKEINVSLQRNFTKLRIGMEWAVMTMSERAKTDGGPAFPIEVLHEKGMSHRDYAAIHADQPGIAEIVSMAGFTYSSGQVWSDGQTSLGPFESWWRSIPNSERFMLSARVRYAMADALLAVKAETDPKHSDYDDGPF